MPRYHLTAASESSEAAVFLFVFAEDMRRQGVIGQFVCPLTGCHSVVSGCLDGVWNSFQSMPVP